MQLSTTSHMKRRLPETTEPRRLPPQAPSITAPPTASDERIDKSVQQLEFVSGPVLASY